MNKLLLFALLCFFGILLMDYLTKWEHHILAIWALVCLVIVVGSAAL